VRGRGVRALVRAGLEVVEGVGERACAEVHEHYLHHERTRRPFVTLKAATSVDGCIAASSGDSKWITGVESRRHGHRLRAQHHAIAVGAQTVLADDPRLDVRLVRGVSPLVVVFDSRLRLAGAGRLHLLREGTWILHTAAAPKRARTGLRALGVELIEVEQDQGRVDLRHALELLGKRCVRSILVEGGGRLLGSFVQAASWERLYLYQAPRILGAGVGAFCGARWEKVADAPSLLVEGRRRMGSDLLSIFRRDAEPRAKRRAAKHRSRA
jgi:diaminohydroxyphosphoribosylaminopyrimidine deaminase/5-amino-6-(5-phosphoribosylamino)uracil reductase